MVTEHSQCPCSAGWDKHINMPVPQFSLVRHQTCSAISLKSFASEGSQQTTSLGVKDKK